MKIFDLHTHLFPARMFLAIWEYFETRNWSVHREQVDEVTATLQRHGVQGAVALSYAHKAGVAHSLNTFMAELRARHDWLYPFASVHVEDADFNEEIDRVLGSEHLFGFKFQPLVQRFDINDRRLDPLCEQCQERQFPVLIHIGSGPVANRFVGPDHFRRLMDRFPALRVCVPHMGVPECSDFLVMLDDYPEMFLDTTMVNTHCELFDTAWRGDVEALKRHSKRICFGSDWPNVPYPYQEAVDSVLRFGFEEADLEDIYWNNARRFVGLADLA
ncbi:MAG: hypothetical protein COW42_01805 [Deltaproteobacteria bacterium CG17_big_fil_post_rev_8_21_14_2_50_63_7]|nr:MAG: hypothetical protein COW42_01805 [Deltaproteobacteria bacterium CG17_big_fil_post_rev_8_21_14_2_50_63_7]